MTSQGVLSIIFILLIELCTSCSPVVHNVEITDLSLPPKPLFEPLPLSVLAIYNNRFLTHHSTSKNNKGMLIHHIQLGESSAEFFDYLLKSAFRELEIVRKPLDDVNIPDRIELIVKPTVSKHSYVLNSNQSYLSLIYRIDYYLPNKELIGFSAVRGRGNEIPRFFLSQKQQNLIFTTATQVAMREIAAKFISRLCGELFILDKFYLQCLNDVQE